MKKFLSLLAAILFATLGAYSQTPAPGIFNYQGVARNSVGTVLINKTITLRLTVHDGTAVGPTVYQESRTVITNPFGLFNVQVGSPGAINVTGTTAGVNWGVGNKYIQVEIDPNGGTTFINIGTAQIASVPYSLYSSLANDLVLPFNKTQADAGTLFRINNSGTGISGAIMGVTQTNAANAWGMHGRVDNTSAGGYSAGILGTNLSTTGNGIGVFGSQNGSGWGVYGTTPGGVGVYGNSTSGMGVYGQSVSGPSIMGYQPNTGTSNAGFFQNFSTTNGAAVLRVLSNGQGEGFGVNMTGSGKGGIITITNAASSNNVFEASTNGLGKVTVLQILNAGNSSNVLDVLTNGLGRSAYFQNTNAANAANALEVNMAGTGYAASFTSINALPKALRTAGALQFTGIGEGVNKVLSTDINGNATWNTLASVGGVSGTGSLNFVAKWTPNGTFIGNSQVFDDGTNLGIGTSTPSAKLHVAGNQKIDGANTLEFGAGVSGKEVNAGKIGYQTFSANALDIVGAGTNAGIRKIKFWNEGGAEFNGNVGIGVANPSFRLDVNANSADYIAVFNNTNNGNGDGIKIKLGKTHPMWDGGGYLSTTDNVINSFTPQINTVKNWVLNGTPITAGDVVNLVTSTGALLLGTLCQLTNFLSSNINTALGLPYVFPGLNFPGLNIVPQICIIDIPAGGDCEVGIGPYGIPPFQIIPPFTLIPAIPQIPCGGLPTIQAPNMSVFNVSNSLTNENNFIVFTDKDDRELGAVRAQSIEEFRTKTLDIAYFFEMVGKFSGVDLSKGLLLGAGEMAKLAFRYNKIGVEYASGHGDYAEWLERENPMENITAGDIVRVKSGKITRDLNGAEQIMVVSHRPIVLGNTPEKDKQPLGNAVAFMGQVPVKVMGPVNGGDYIVAKGDFAGMGVAVKPENMTTQDFRLCVGRSWETNESNGPKMVNTVVGVHNNDFLKIVADLQQKTMTTELRLKMIEEKLNIPADTTKNPGTNKKAF